MTIERAAMARLAVLMAAMFVDMMGMLMVLPLLPFYAQHLGGNATLIGILVAAQPFAAVVTAPFWGRFSDRIGRRPAILFGLAASGTAYLMFGFADTLWLLMLSRLVQGVGAGTVGVIQAYVSDTVGPENRAKALGWITVATSAGVAVGPVIGSLATHLGRSGPGIVAAGMALLNVIVAAKLLPEPAVTRSTAKRRQLRHALLDVLRHPGHPAHRMIWIYTAGMMAFMAMNAVLALFLQRRFGVNAGNIGYFYAYVGTIGIIMRGGVLGRLVDKLGEVRVLRLGALALCAGQAVLPLVPNLVAFAVVVALSPIGTALLFPATTSQVSRHAPPGHVGEFMGLQQAFGGVARMLGPICAGFVFQHLGVAWPFWLAAALMGGVGVLAFGAAVEQRDDTTPAQVEAAETAIAATGASEAGNVEASPAVVESAAQSR